MMHMGSATKRSALQFHMALQVSGKGMHRIKGKNALVILQLQIKNEPSYVNDDSQSCCAFPKYLAPSELSSLSITLCA